MIDYDGIRAVIAKGLSEYLKCPVIRSNQAKEPPSYPYISYTITMLASQNNGTYGEYSDGVDRKPVTQTWSITALSDKDGESTQLANKAVDWLERVGSTYLNENNIIVQRVGNVTNRDNFLTVEYEYRNGFDMVIYLMNETTRQADTIDNVELINENEGS